MTPLAISAYTLTSALGAGLKPHVDALINGATGLSPEPFETCALQCWTGQVKNLDTPLSGAAAPWDCRNNRLTALALEQDGFRTSVEQARSRYGAHRIGIYLGTSTSGVHQTEIAYDQRDRNVPCLPDWFDFSRTQNVHSAAQFVREILGLDGVSLMISTACSSSAKAFAAAVRGIACGHCDAAIVGGVDSLCMTTLYGFNSLQLLSKDICRPADIKRNGLSIGEAAGFALLDPNAGSSLKLLGYGESSDAYHMSAPAPDGRGALDAMNQALIRAGMTPTDVDYINLHGTATPANDLSEDKAITQLFGFDTPCSSTKGYIGHTLGAAGIAEAVLSLLCLQQGVLPKSLNTQTIDPELNSHILTDTRRATLRSAMSNSFGFGGSNCSLLLGQAA